MPRTFDVAIIGASIAGSSLALQLGRDGISVALIDKAHFPRRKACGEGLGGRAVAVLDELGLLAELERLPHSRFRGFRLWRGATPAAVRLGDQEPGFLGIQRELLDAVLFRAAANTPGVEVFLGHQVRTIDAWEPLAQLTVGGHTLRARHLVLADGANSFIAERSNIPARREPQDRYGIVHSLQGTFDTPISDVNVFVRQGFEVYCTPVGPNRLTVALLGTKKALASLSKREDRDSLIATELRQSCDTLRFTTEATDNPRGIGPLGRVSRAATFRSALLVGDACENLDPIAGMGMTHALLSSQAAARALRSVLSGTHSKAGGSRQFTTQRERAVRPLRGFTQLTRLALRGLPERQFHLLANLGLTHWLSRTVHQERGALAHTVSGKLSEHLLSVTGLLSLLGT